MKKPQLLDLISSVIVDINSINTVVEKIKQQGDNTDTVNTEVNWEGGLLSTITAASKEIDEKLSSIQEAYIQIIWDKETQGMKDNIEELVSELIDDKKKIDTFKVKIFGTEKTEEGWTETTINEWLSKELDDFFANWKIKYDKLISDIETRLSPSATSVQLAITFKTKVDEFKKSGKFWSWAFMIVLSFFIWYFAIVVFEPTSSKTLTEEWVQFLHRVPLIWLVIWLGGFIGNRRAESKKLEESYKHKEVMASSYTGYRRTIEDLDDNDNTLLKKHMDNLLTSINEDSGKFLKTEGEQHPFNFFPKNPLNKDKE